MAAITPTNVPIASGLVARRVDPVMVPLFDPPYSIDAILSNTFSRSSPWPHLLQDFRRNNVGNNGSMFYEKSQVLRPFGVDTLTWGNLAFGTATGNVKSSYYADKSIIASQNISPAGFYHPNNLLALGAGIQTLGINGSPFPIGAFGTGPSYAGIEPFFQWIPVAFEWAFASLNYIVDVLTIAGGNECDVWIPMPIVSGVDFQADFGIGQNFVAWFNNSITGKIVRVTNAYTQGIGKNIYTLELNNPVGGTLIYFLGEVLFPNNLNMQLAPLTFDDANIQALVNAGNYELQGTNFGWILTWAKSTYALIPGQGVQSILLAATVDPDMNEIRNPSYAPIIYMPQTTKSNTAVSINNIASVKVDPNGILYLRNNGGGADLTYVANSQGLDISIPGVSVDMSKANGNLSIPSFCPCSPVAVPIGGA